MKLYRQYDRNTLIYLFYSGTPAVLHRSIQYIFLRSLGIDTSAIFSLWGMSYLLNAVLEFPIGLISDRIPRRYILALSSFLFLLAQTFYIFVTPSKIVLLYVSAAIEMISTSLYSGTKSAILADHLRSENRFQDFALIQSTALLLMRMMTLVLVAVGGILYAHHSRAPFYGNIIILFLGTFAILNFREKALLKTEIFTPIISPLNLDLKKIWGFVFYSAFLSSFFFFTGNLLQPYLEKVHHLQIKEQIFVYQLYLLAGVIGGFILVPWLRRRKVNYNIMFLFIFAGLIFLFFSFQISTLFAIGLFFFLRLIDGIQNIFFLNEIHFHTHRGTRATILSIKSIIESLIRALFHFAVGSSFISIGNNEDNFRKILGLLGIIYLTVLVPAPFYFKKILQRNNLHS